MGAEMSDDNILYFDDPEFERKLADVLLPLMRPDVVHCFRCKRTPDEIDEYCHDPELSPHEYVLAEEGTLNRITGEFCCTKCYVEIGMPVTPRGWTP